MSDVIGELAKVHRAVTSSGGTGHTVVLRRTYQAAIEDVWDAITDPERLSRWLAPVTGDFRLGGRYQIQGNAAGEIVQCEPPRLLVVTWVYGEVEGDPSQVQVRLETDDRGNTELELAHHGIIDDEHWNTYGPGAVGVGWELSLLGLGWHLAGRTPDPAGVAEWERSEEAREFLTGSSRAWGETTVAAGHAPDQVSSMVENTTRFYVPER
jgi:uncharacterized protein YndB with AHSA1/START domain